MPGIPRSLLRYTKAFFGLLGAVAALSCGSDGDDRLAVIVKVDGLTPQIVSLTVSATLNDQLASNPTMQISEHLDSFVVYLAKTTEGTLKIDVGAFSGAATCESAHAQVLTPVHPAPPRVIEVSAELKTASPPLCPVTIDLVGEGAVQAASGGLSCDSRRCRGVFPQNAMVVLNAVPGPRSADQVMWAPLCPVAAPSCTVQVAQPLSLSATFTKLPCSPAKWCQHNVGTTLPNVHTVWSRGPSDVWIAGNNSFVSHFDGKAWKRASVAPDSTYTFYAVASSGPNDAVVGGGIGASGLGSLFAWNGSTWQKAADPGHQIRDLRVTPTGGRAVGDSGLLYHRTGGVWSGNDSAMPTYVFYGSWSSGNADYIVATQGKVLVSSPGTTSLQDLGMKSPQALFGIWGTSDSEMWAVGQGGYAAHNNGTWGTAQMIASVDLNGIWGSAPNDYWAVGNSATLLHYTGSWSTVNTGGTELYRAIGGSSANDVWIVGDNGLVLQYTP